MKAFILKIYFQKFQMVISFLQSWEYNFRNSKEALEGKLLLLLGGLTSSCVKFNFQMVFSFVKW